MITQVVTFTLKLAGDGSSTSVSVDLTDQIRLLGILPRTPSAVQSISNEYGATATLNGAVVNISFTTAPPTSNTTYTLVLEF